MYWTDTILLHVQDKWLTFQTSLQSEQTVLSDICVHFCVWLPQNWINWFFKQSNFVRKEWCIVVMWEKAFWFLMAVRVYIVLFRYSAPCSLWLYSIVLGDMLPDIQHYRPHGATGQKTTIIILFSIFNAVLRMTFLVMGDLNQLN